MKFKKLLNDLFANMIIAMMISLVVWVIAAQITFGLRHPWATDTERLLCTYEVMTFKKVPYNQMRPRE